MEIEALLRMKNLGGIEARHSWGTVSLVWGLLACAGGGCDSL